MTTSLLRFPAAAALLACSLLATGSSVAAAQGVRDASADAERYQKCMTLARSSKPDEGWETAQEWKAAGGAHPAEHCAAVSLIGMKQYTEAAVRLEKLAADMAKGPPMLRVDVLAQAGQAWLLAGQPDRAQGALTDALGISPNDPDLLIDRSEAFAARNRYAEAIADLDRAVELEPRRADTLIYRASAHRELKQYDAALADIEKALKFAPDSPDALLERGNIRRLTGDSNGARRDWVQVSLLAPNTPADEAAKANIERLDVKGGIGSDSPEPVSAAPVKKRR
jgi:tetratricopeptide (TPR) repeat protein